jgi:hypothetical protein
MVVEAEANHHEYPGSQTRWQLLAGALCGFAAGILFNIMSLGSVVAASAAEMKPGDRMERYGLREDCHE